MSTAWNDGIEKMAGMLKSADDINDQTAGERAQHIIKTRWSFMSCVPVCLCVCVSVCVMCCYGLCRQVDYKCGMGRYGSGRDGSGR